MQPALYRRKHRFKSERYRFLAHVLQAPVAGGMAHRLDPKSVQQNSLYRGHSNLGFVRSKMISFQCCETESNCVMKSKRNDFMNCLEPRSLWAGWNRRQISFRLLRKHQCHALYPFYIGSLGPRLFTENATVSRSHQSCTTVECIKHSHSDLMALVLRSC